MSLDPSKLSTSKILLNTLLPGVGETLYSKARMEGNLGVGGIARQIIFFRNTTYIGAALNAISFAGLFFFTPGRVASLFLRTTWVTSLALAGLCVKKLYDIALLLNTLLNTSDKTSS